jgi:hypothetical protein
MTLSLWNYWLATSWHILAFFGIPRSGTLGTKQRSQRAPAKRHGFLIVATQVQQRRFSASFDKKLQPECRDLVICRVEICATDGLMVQHWHFWPLVLKQRPAGDVRGYNDGIETDANEAQIAMCTLRSFPYLPRPQQHKPKIWCHVLLDSEDTHTHIYIYKNYK